MQTGEVAKALGVHYNTAYNLAKSEQVKVSKGSNGQYDWTQANLEQAREVQASKAQSGATRKPATNAKSKATQAGVSLSDTQDQKVLAFLARERGKDQMDVLHEILQAELERVRLEVDTLMA